MYDTFKELVAQGKVERSRLASVRVKLHVPCQWTCHFCHMEGNHGSQPVRNDAHYRETLEKFRDTFGFTEVHLTGGEPSIHPEIVGFIEAATSLGFRVKMTTNGQAKISRYEKCVTAGLQEINISIHTLCADELAKIMTPPKTKTWAEKAIAAQLALVDALYGNIPIKLNTCVGESEGPAMAVADFVRGKPNVSWRLMNVLEIPAVSYASLKRACQKLGAKPVRAQVIDGSSSCSVVMECDDGFKFKLKLIQPHYLEGMCSNCELRRYGGCYEFAYGPRLEMERGMLMVRNCIHRDGPPFSLPTQSFFSHPLAEQLREKL